MIRKKPLLILSLVFAFLSVGASLPPTSKESCTPIDANIFVNLSKKIVPSVVNISTITTVKSPFGPGTSDEMLRKFFGDLFRQYNGGRGDEDDGDTPMLPPPRGPKMPKAMSLGTGFILDSSGLILTNNHVVADADEIKISFTEAPDEKPSDAEVVGRDPEIDVALIKVKTSRSLTPVALGDSDSLEVGEYVIAVGNPFGQGHSVTHGIISAKGRHAPDFPLASYLQTDAPINPGNSGGPLVNLKGEVIGINNAIDQRAQGIGFAIPINLVKKVIPQLRSKGLVARGYIGVGVDVLTPEVAASLGLPKDLQGPLVSHVNPNEPADKAGVKPYDVILEFNGKRIYSNSELVTAVTSVPVGESVPMKIVRGPKTITLTIKVEQRPGSLQALSKEDGHNRGQKKPKRIETGMTLENLTPSIARELGLGDKTSGALVTNIEYGGPADKVGIGRGDVILEVDQKPIKNVDDFFNTVKSKKSYLLKVRRNDPQGREIFSVVVLNLTGQG